LDVISLAEYAETVEERKREGEIFVLLKCIVRDKCVIAYREEGGFIKKDSINRIEARRGKWNNYENDSMVTVRRCSGSVILRTRRTTLDEICGEFEHPTELA